MILLSKIIGAYKHVALVLKLRCILPSIIPNTTVLLEIESTTEQAFIAAIFLLMAAADKIQLFILVLHNMFPLLLSKQHTKSSIPETRSFSFIIANPPTVRFFE